MADRSVQPISRPDSEKLVVTRASLEYFTSNATILALDDVSFDLDFGDSVGIAGESGCGKSTLAFAIIRALPDNARMLSGKVVLGDVDIYALSEHEMDSRIRWKEIAMIPQSAMNTFDPVFTIQDQLVETIRTHSDVGKSVAISRAKELLELVGIEAKRSNSYPHQLSGGMKQRAAIALALSMSPKILIADEPTTALDVIVQAQIMALLIEIRQKFGTSLILISHDLSLVAQYCRKVVIMYAGKVVEVASAEELFSAALHPYTIGLLQSVPNLIAPKTVLKSIPGSPPDLVTRRKGCSFAPRCSYANNQCFNEVPKLLEISPNHFSACFEWKQILDERMRKN